MARQADLEKLIRESYDIILEYEEIRQLSSDPKEKRRAPQEIAEQWALIRGWLREYERVAPSGWPEDLVQIAARFEQEGAAEAARQELPQVIKPSQTFEPELVLIPAGEFLMGSDKSEDKKAYNEERPQHYIYLLSYYIARTPVTNFQYATFVSVAGRRAPKHWKGGKIPSGKEDHPVVNVNWHDVLAYCRWLSETTGRHYTLPNEAEWEKAGRGTDGRIWPWGNVFDKEKCNSSESGIEDTTPVGDYPAGASPYGLLDMAGNIWEWTRSLFESYPYKPDDGREDLSAEGYRVLRGGSFLHGLYNVRCAYRFYVNLEVLLRDSGFRVVVAPSSSKSDLGGEKGG